MKNYTINLNNIVSKIHWINESHTIDTILKNKNNCRSLEINEDDGNNVKKHGHEALVECGVNEIELWKRKLCYFTSLKVPIFGTFGIVSGWTWTMPTGSKQHKQS